MAKRDDCTYSERYRRLERQKEVWQRKQERCGERRQRTWRQKISFLQEQQARWREQECWHLQQPDRWCSACRQHLPASAFECFTSAGHWQLRMRCRICHEAMLERQRLPCCLCKKKIPRRDFLSQYGGYALCDNGCYISLCCKDCEAALQNLPQSLQKMYIQRCCQRVFPAGQIIYAEVDPEAHDVRYIGRTGRPARRQAQHLSGASPVPGQWGSERIRWYTCSNWIHELLEKGLVPSMQTLQRIDNPSFVIEWEQRYIWHGIQQGWRLLNVETMDAELVHKIRSSSLDFLTVPFEILVQQHYFAERGLVAFLHRWCQLQ